MTEGCTGSRTCGSTQTPCSGEPSEKRMFSATLRRTEHRRLPLRAHFAPHLLGNLAPSIGECPRSAASAPRLTCPNVTVELPTAGGVSHQWPFVVHTNPTNGLWVPIIRSWALTRGYALHPGTRNRYEIQYTRTQHRPASRQVNDHGRVLGTHTVFRAELPIRGSSRAATKRHNEHAAAPANPTGCVLLAAIAPL